MGDVRRWVGVGLVLLAGCVIHEETAEVVEPAAPRTAASGPVATPAPARPPEPASSLLVAAGAEAEEPRGPVVVAAPASTAAQAVALPPASATPVVGPACARPLPGAAPAIVRLEDLLEQVRRVVAAHRAGAPICDASLQALVEALVQRLGAAGGRGQLPFTPGGPRSPLASGRSSYSGRDPQLADADVTMRDGVLGHVERALVLIDGSASIGFLTDSIVIATGDLDVAHVDSSTVIAGGFLLVSHSGTMFEHRVGIPNVLVAGSWLRVSNAHGPLVASGEGAHVEYGQDVALPAVPPGVVLRATTDSPLAARVEAGVGPGLVPRACVFARGGGGAPLACALEGEALRDAGPVEGFTVLFSSPALVVLARGADRLRLVPHRPVPPAPPPRLPLPAGAEIHLLGFYDLPAAAGRVPVAIHRTDAPAVLILKAYARAHWELLPDPGVRIAAVVLAGYEPSWVAGVPAGTPVVTLIEQAGAPSTGEFHDRPGVLGAARAVFGADVEPASFAAAERVGGFEIR